MQRTWTVWDEMRAHRVGVSLNVLGGGTHVSVDGTEVVNLGGWRGRRPNHSHPCGWPSLLALHRA
ncbi:MAG: hypothetical protein LC744_02700 [Chloroflexi bacterium]|nr:hypothetical protein [Chloroflexota bacterium]